MGPAFRGLHGHCVCRVTKRLTQVLAQRRDLDNPQEHARGSEAQEHRPDHGTTTAVASIRQSMGLPLREMLAHRR